MIIQNYWNSVWRNLMKRKGFSFINIFGLAVGHGISFIDIYLRCF